MRVTACHAVRGGGVVRGGGGAVRVVALLSVAVASVVALTAAAVVVVSRSGGLLGAASGTRAFSSGGSAASGESTPSVWAMLDTGAMLDAGAGALTISPVQPVSAGRLGLVAGSGATASPAGVAVLLTLGPLIRQVCPVTAAACVDLADHLTWLQSGGRITYGPVRMEPGPPGPHATPRGTFYVSWKGGPGLISNEYHEPMPYAVFFAPGGIAFHGGSLTVPSHGCVHLTIANARYYHDHLPLGAKVVVF